jgi:uncharacterized protein (TIGR03790 family)
LFHWPKPDEERVKQAGSSSVFFDRPIHPAGELVRKSGRMPVVIDDKEQLFKEGECPDAALYCGWYSLASYTDAFSWKHGAVGYHLAGIIHEHNTLAHWQARSEPRA